MTEQAMAPAFRRDGFLVIALRCLPDAVDPRGPKGK
jgi:hypothetical protein